MAFYNFIEEPTPGVKAVLFLNHVMAPSSVKEHFLYDSNAFSDFIYKMLQVRRQHGEGIAILPTGVRGLILENLGVVEDQNLREVLQVQGQRICAVAIVHMRE